MHVLIVDDEPHIRTILARILHGAGHTTCWASDGHGALRLLFGEAIDLILLDMHLPDMSGWDVARAKYSDPKLRPIPIIVLSGMDLEEVRAISRVNVLENATILNKPFYAKDVLQAIEDAVPIQNRRDTKPDFTDDEEPTKP